MSSGFPLIPNIGEYTQTSFVTHINMFMSQLFLGIALEINVHLQEDLHHCY